MWVVLATEPALVKAAHAIRPLLSTQWSQLAPYNDFCPEGSPTGCVATAMAQVMRYYEWPKSVTTSIPAYGGYDELPPTTFAWPLMKGGYGGDESADSREAVARLMQYCGHAVQMGYGQSSSANDETIPSVMRRFFCYDGGVRMVYRSDYTAAEWEALICGELAFGRPVIYIGQRSGLVHAFVCDGYDGQGLFHINWGWGGYSDGWYRLSALIPPYIGEGDANIADGFSMYQSAIVGLQPDCGGTAPVSVPLLTAEELRVVSAPVLTRSGSDQTFQLRICCPVANHSADTLKSDFGLALMQDGQLIAGTERLFGRQTFVPGSYVNRIAGQKYTFGKGLTGNYRLVSVCSSNDGLQPVSNAGRHYIDVELTETSLTLTEHPRRNLEVGEVLFRQIDGLMVVTATVTNRGDDYIGQLCFFNSGLAVASTGVMLDAGTSDVVTFRFRPHWSIKDYTIGYSKDDETWLAEGPVDVVPEYSKGTFSVWYADGTSDVLTVGDGGVAVVPPEALAVDFGNDVPTSVVPNGNPNCLYYVVGHPALAAQLPNVVADRYIATLTLVDGHGFYCPMAFTAGHITFTRTFVRGYDEYGGGWDTIILPFDVETVTAKGLAPIDWFRSAQDTGKDFWLMTLGDSGERNLAFDHARQMEANRPYLIAVPGQTYGDRSLTGIPVTFAADHAVVHQTALTTDTGGVYSFMGGADGQDGQLGRSFQLNYNGSMFIGTMRAAGPFRAKLSKRR